MLYLSKCFCADRELDGYKNLFFGTILSNAPSRNQKNTLNQKLRTRLNQSGFCVCNLHQRHINTAPEKPHSHAFGDIC